MSKPSNAIAPLTSYAAVQAFITKVLTDNNEMGGVPASPHKAAASASRSRRRRP